MINANFAILGALLPLLGSVSYVRDTLRGRTKPNLVSWGLWSLAPLIAFVAELIQKASLLESLLTFCVGFGPMLVVISALIVHHAYWKLTKFDIFCGAFSLLALALWAITGKGNVAIVFSILSDMLASIPTIIKGYKAPETESFIAFIPGVIGGTITLLTVQYWVFANYAFTLYICIISVIISGSILLGRRLHASRLKV